MNYLVTGAAGFIAARVCEMLLAEGHTVVGVDNLNDYYDVRLKDYRLSCLLGAKSKELGADPKKSVYADGVNPLISGNFEFRLLDIENLAALDALFAAHKFDAVFNLAARAGVRYSMENPHVYLSTNTLGTLNILECQRKYGVKKQVLASTSSLYAGCPMPFTEDQPVNTPLSPYAATKKAAEMLAYTYHKLYGLDITVVRYFTVFGPAGRPDMAPYRFIHWVATGQPIKLFGDGTQSRDFTYVDDIARGTILAGRFVGGQMIDDGGQTVASGQTADSAQTTGEKRPPSTGDRSPSTGYEVINLGGGNRPITINVMIELIENYLGKKAVIDHLPANPVDMTDTQADITKAGHFLDWSPQVSPEEGFRKTVEWYLENSDWLKGIRL